MAVVTGTNLPKADDTLAGGSSWKPIQQNSSRLSQNK